MAYRMTFASNPKLLVVVLIIAAFLAAGVSLFLVSPFLGIVGIALGGYISYTLVRFISKQMASVLDVQEDGLHFNLYGEEQMVFEWDNVSHMGLATAPKSKRFFFAYREDEDKLLVVPNEFQNFEQLLDDIRAQGDLVSVELERSEGVKEQLKEMLGVQLKAAEGEAEADPEEDATGEED